MTEPTGTETTYCKTRCFSWTAVVVGALVAIGLSFLLNVFNVAIGLSAFTTSPEGNATLAVGGFVALTIGSIVTMFVAGLVAGYLGQAHGTSRHTGELYGFSAWCLALIVTIFLTTHVANFVSHAAAAVNAGGATMSLSANATNSTATTQNPDVNSYATTNTEKVANRLGAVAFVTFFLFFIGALSSCFGGRCGMTCCRSDASCHMGSK